MKLFYRSIIVITLAFFGFSQSANASHISGGDISYVCVGQDSFMITLSLFRDCAGIPAPASAAMTFSSTCGGTATATLTKQSFSEISQLCPTQIPNSTCNGGSWPGMEQHIYSGIVVLSPPCNTWTMAWSSCCRNALVTNVNPNGTYLYNTMYSGVDSCNSSPTFTSLPIPYVCNNQVVNYNFGVVEPDGDSIVYFLSPGFTGPTALVTYVAPYTFTQPVSGANAVLNAFNGQLTFTPTATGVYVIVVRIEEYDPVTGVIKGTSIRDIQVVVQNCSNLQPEIDSPGMYNFSGTGVQIDSNTIEVCIGDSFAFDVAISDPDTSNTVNIYHNIYSALDSSAVVTMTPGNPAILHVSWIAQPGSPSFISFTITGIDDACPVVGLVSGVFNIHINPSTYAGLDQTICQGTQWANLQATGGTSFTWVAVSGSPVDTIPTSPNYNMTCWHCDNPSVSPQVTTTYVVYSNLTSTCTNFDTVVVVVAPNFDITMPNDTIICPIDSITLNTSVNPSNLNFNYQWSHGSTIDYDTILSPSGLPIAPTNYRVTISEAGGCIKTGTVFIDLSPPFPPGITISGDTVICFGDSTQLAVNLGDLASVNCGLSIGACVGALTTGIIGTGTQTNSTTSYPAPYGNYYWGAKHQILYTAAELHAMGMVNGGKITSISFDIATLGTVSSFNNFEVKMGCTSSSDLAAAWETGLVTVLPAYAHTATTGWNVHTFTNAYDWDGVSNLVIQICQNQSSWSSAGGSASRFTPTGFQSVRYYRADNANVCSSTNAGTASNSRPNIKFEYCSGADPLGFNYSWAPNSNIDSINIVNPTVYPPTTATYNVVVTDTFGTCSDTITHQVQVVTSFDAGFVLMDTICVNGDSTIALPFIGGGIFSGNGIIDSLVGVFDPLVAGVGTWPINYTVSSPTGGCLSDSTQNIEVISAPDATITPFEICEGSPAVSLTAATSGGIWSGLGVTDPINGIFDPIGLSPGYYDIVYNLTVPCFSVDTFSVKVIKPYSFTFTNPIITVCQDDSVSLANNYVLSTDPLQGNGPVFATWSEQGGAIDSISGMFNATNLPDGDYIVTLELTGANGECGTSQTMIVRVTKIDYPEFPNSLVFCSDLTKAVIYVNPWLFGNGASFIQTPIAPLGATDTLDIQPFGPNGKFNASTSGLGSWELEVTYTNLNGCTGVSTDTIHVLLTPEEPDPIPTVYCEGEEIVLVANATTPDSVYWYGDINLTDTIGIGNDISWGTAPDPTGGPYYVWATQNNWECISASNKFLLDVKESPVAAFEMTYTDTQDVNQVNIPHQNSPIYGYTPFLVEFNAIGTVPSDSLMWYHHYEVKLPTNAPDNSPNASNSANVSYNYATANINAKGELITETFINQLVVTNEFGCKDTANAQIYSVASEQEYNVFTPNGDGLNDIFYLPIFGVNDLKIQIYNRWGKLVYEWEDATQGWNGEDQPDGVYFYVVTGTNNDAAKSEYSKQGTVTLTGSGK